MPAPSGSPLQAKAVNDAVAHVKTLLKGDIAIEKLEADQSWHDKELREIFEQPMRLWYGYGDFDVFLNDKNVPVGFIDKSKLAGSIFRDLPHPEIVKLAAGTGFIPANSRVLSTGKGPANTLQAVLITDPKVPDAPRVVVQINTKHKRVISLVPEGVTP